ncbi:potassium transporter TrkG [Paenibacillus cisolokensis]|uniref:Ktr system potassium uptake protein D n=1 Tax=Paenibacillus cisolokensis TaxID=1658519 RepID=A0ABQ4N947_9BACL|nr:MULTISPECIES: potassium transporter TrkG [Paenibacillus]ALS29622.1 ATP synthase [Paenibacillus sp. 32O-W]GIQ64778.1 ktr system potassium uptake protein D [Paenibacillus cisolokensis]
MKRLAKSLSSKITPARILVLGYLIAVILSSVVLTLPISLQEGVRIGWFDALFTATSAVSVTGLTVVPTDSTFSFFGKFALMFMFQLGGIGIMTMGAFVWLILGRNITLSQRRLIMVDQNRPQLSGLVNVMRMVLMMSLIIEGTGTLILTFYFKAAGYHEEWLEALGFAIFHSVSSFTNAGFDIYGDSLYRFAADYFVQSVTIVLLVLGAIGFPVLIELREYWLRRNEKFRFSLYTKMTGLMYMLLVVVGTVGILLFERGQQMESLPWHEQLFYALFHSVSTRSGGLATTDGSFFSLPSQLLLAILMFIGASPSSVGGGIRTTTFGVMLLTLYNYALGRNEVRAFNRAIKQEDVTKSFVVFSVASILVLGSTMLIASMEPPAMSLAAILYEVCSAFGTSGLTLGITTELSLGSKIVLIVLMFIGRIGVLVLLYLFRSRKQKQLVHYPKEDIIIG